MARSPPTGPPCFNGVSQWLKTSYTPFYKHTTPFLQANRHFSQFLEPVLAPKCSKIERDKMVQNEKNGPPLGVPQWGAPMGLIFTCIPHFTSKEVILQPVFVDFLSDAPPQRRDAYPQSSGHRVVLGEVVST